MLKVSYLTNDLKIANSHILFLERELLIRNNSFENTYLCPIKRTFALLHE